MAKPSKAPAAQNSSVTIDRAEFIRTRDALTSAYMHLSLSMDRMVKAYLDHTQTVLDGDESLNVSYLLAPLNGASATIQALLPGAAAAGAEGPAAAVVDEKPSKRRRKAERDPNAPKRPLTAYFRYLQEQRHKISDEIQANPKKFEMAGKPGDLSKIATERWNALSADDQEPYRAAYRDDMLDYEKAVKEYKASGGGIGAVSGDADEEPIVPAGKTSRLPEDVSTDSSDDDSSDDSSDSDDEPAPPPPTSAKKSSAKKKTTAAAAVAPTTINSTSAPAKPMFSSIPVEAPTPASKPERKRKAAAAAPAEAAADSGEPAKKKRGRKPKADAVVDEPATPAAAAAAAAELPATTTPAAEEKSAKKKREKKRKSTGA